MVRCLFALSLAASLAFAPAAAAADPPDGGWVPGARRKSLMASFYYEGLRFDESPKVYFPIDPTTALAVWQPRSDADIFGLRLGYVF